VSRRLNIPIPDALTLEAMAGAKRTARMSGGQSTYQLLRETFFDTPEGTLRENQITLRLRAEARGRQVLELRVLDAVNLQGVVEETILETPVVSGGLYGTLAGTSEVATRVREFTELDALRPQVWTRSSASGEPFLHLRRRLRRRFRTRCSLHRCCFLTEKWHSLKRERA
jgi:hypothetical protein